jgi:hypothetical protein
VKPGTAPRAYNGGMTTPPLSRDHLSAALAARRELGPDYDEAFIDAIVARIDETLETRLAGRRAARTPHPVRAKADRDSALSVAIISLVTSIPLTAISVTQGGLVAMLAVWIGIVLVNVVFVHRPGAR